MTLTKKGVDLVNELTQLKIDNKHLRECLQDFVNYVTIGEDVIMDSFVKKANKLLKK